MSSRRLLSPYLALWIGIAALTVAGNVTSAPTFARGGASSSQLAQVKFIKKGLSVQPPHKKSAKGKVKEKLYTAYGLQTQAKQFASIGFKDKTVLHMNQRTAIQLMSPSITYVKNGEVDEALVPGTNHKVQTAAAVASAIGTNFDVEVSRHASTIIVLHGVVRVKNKLGTVTVKPNHESVVINGQPPQPPKKVDAAKAMSWTQGLPTPSLPENVALDAAGGKVIAFTSQYRSSTIGNFWDAKFINDGRLDYGWQTASGNITNESVTIALPAGKTYKVSEFVIDPAATHGDPSSSDLKDFDVRVSTTGTDDASFTTVFSGTCEQKSSLQRFTLSQPVTAKYVQLIAKDNYGSPDWISVAEFEVVATPA